MHVIPYDLTCNLFRRGKEKDDVIDQQRKQIQSLQSAYNNLLAALLQVKAQQKLAEKRKQSVVASCQTTSENISIGNSAAPAEEEAAPERTRSPSETETDSANSSSGDLNESSDFEK